jgi:hypothetical protein
LKNWDSSSNGAARQGDPAPRKKKPFAYLTWKDVLIYLEQSQEADELYPDFRPRAVEDLPLAGDFFSLGTALLLTVPATGDRLALTAWTRSGPRPSWSLPLDPPLKLRLTAGVPQVLTGPEKAAILAFASRVVAEPGMLVALPLVAEPRTLVGALILLDSPPFDLEDEDFVLAWTQYKYTLLQGLYPRRQSVPVYAEAALMRTLENGHSFLAVELDTTALAAHCDEHGLPHQRARRLIEKSLEDLAGTRGAVLWRPPKLTALFVLPARMDEGLLWHQIEAGLARPAGFIPDWRRRVLRTPVELQAVLGR